MFALRLALALGLSLAQLTAAAPLPLSISLTSKTQRAIAQPCGFSQTLGKAKGDGLRIARVRWVQGVALDPDDPDTILAGGKDTLVRVDVIADRARVKAPGTRTLWLKDAGSKSCRALPLKGPAWVPQQLDPSQLGNAFTAVIPAARLQPGLTLVIQLGDGARSAVELDALIRADAPAVLAPIREDLRLIPLTVAGRTGVAPAPDQVQGLLTRLFPLASVQARVEPGVTVSALSNLAGEGGLPELRAALNAVDTRCRQLNWVVGSARTAIKCLGLLPNGVTFRPANSPNSRYTGLSFVGGISGVIYAPTRIDVPEVTSPYEARHWVTREAKTLAHEFGHLMNLNHGACGNTGSVDPRLAADGLMHGEGWDRQRGVYFSSEAEGDEPFSDLMSYCDKGWMSPEGYLAALRYRAGTQVAARVIGTAPQWLEIQQAEGQWQVRPSLLTPGRLTQTRATADVAGTRQPVFSAVLSEGGTNDAGPWYVMTDATNVGALTLTFPGQAARVLPVLR